jgi:hypothetical protein
MPGRAVASFARVQAALHTSSHTVRCARLVHLWATRWTIYELSFDSRQGQDTFFFHNFQTGYGPHARPPIHWLPEAIFPGRKDGRSHIFSDEFKYAWSYTSVIIRLHDVVLNSAQGQFIF